MRLGSSSDSKDKNKQTTYADQNNQLKKLHEERMLRQQQKQQTSMQDQSASSYMQKQMKIRDESMTNLPKNLFLNSLLSDDRKITKKPNSIALSSLFQEDPKTFGRTISKNIKGILMTSYGYVMDVLGTIAESGVPFVLINDSSQNGQGRVQRNIEGYKNMSLIIPPRTHKGYGVFHAKIWLIRFTTFLRVVICTGNQHAQDWIVWLNAYWFQDFPLKVKTIGDYNEPQEKPEKVQKQPEKVQKKKDTKKIIQTKDRVQQIDNFVSLLDDQDQCEIVEKKKYGKKQQKKQQQKQQKKEQKKEPFNFTQDFVETLSMMLKKMSPPNFDLQKQIGVDLKKYDFSGVKVVLIPSIPGRHSLKDGQMNKFGLGKLKSVMKQLGPKIKKGTLSYNTSSLGNVDQNFLRQIYFSFLPYAQSFSTTNYKLIYPSYKYITQETCGQASVLFLKKQNYYRSQIKKQVFYHYEPSNKNPVKGAIPHLKTVIVQDLQSKQKNKCIFFMGSHNMTKAAWGTYEKDETQLSFSNTELGLLFLQMDKQQLLNWLPYKYPPKKYSDYDKPFLRD